VKEKLKKSFLIFILSLMVTPLSLSAQFLKPVPTASQSVSAPAYHPWATKHRAISTKSPLRGNFKHKGKARDPKTGLAMVNPGSNGNTNPPKPVSGGNPVSQGILKDPKGQPITMWAPGQKPNYPSIYQDIPVKK
jgi:hypothetical protein